MSLRLGVDARQRGRKRGVQGGKGVFYFIEFGLFSLMKECRCANKIKGVSVVDAKRNCKFGGCVTLKAADVGGCRALEE